jgi:dTDP-4-dehydrorhamnose reductase
MYAKYTVLSILGLVEKNSVGIFHVVGNERLSKYSFGQILAGELGLGELVVSQKADQNFLTVRSEELSLDNSKLKAAIGQVPTIYESIREALAEIESGVESGAE